MTNTLLPEMSRELLRRQVQGKQIKEVKVSMAGEDFAYEIR